jgi:hypothetical protein
VTTFAELRRRMEEARKKAEADAAKAQASEKPADAPPDQSGGLVVTSDIWLTARIAAMREIADFDLRYARALQGPMVAGASAEEMAVALAMYPMLKDGLTRMRDEAVKLDGTAILTILMKIDRAQG